MQIQRSQCATCQVTFKAFYWKIFPEEVEINLGSDLKARAQMWSFHIEIRPPTYLKAKRGSLVIVKPTVKLKNL